MPLRYSPGDQWIYGLGHDVQAYLVEVFSGMKYEDYVRKAIFEPLGMRSTVFGVPPAMKARFAMVYNRDAEGKLVADVADRYARYTDHAFGTLSLSSSAPDYLRFAQMLLNGGELDGVRILGRKTVELMSQNHLPANIASISANGPAAAGYGLGVSVTLDTAALGRPGSAGSFGWGGAATTTFTVNPVENMTIVLMAQKMPNDDALLRRLKLVYRRWWTLPVSGPHPSGKIAPRCGHCTRSFRRAFHPPKSFAGRRKQGAPPCRWGAAWKLLPCFSSRPCALSCGRLVGRERYWSLLAQKNSHPLPWLVASVSSPAGGGNWHRAEPG